MTPSWKGWVACVLAIVALGAEQPDVDFGGLRLLLDQGQYAEAEAGARALVLKEEAAQGSNSLATARALDLLVEALLGGGKEGDPGTRDAAARAVSIKTAMLGADHAEVAESLRNQGLLLRKQADLDGARAVLERALAIREKAFGPESLEVAASLVDLANVQQTQSRYAEARATYERALAIQEKTLGGDSPEIARTLNGLAILLTDIGDYDGAKSRFERVLAIREKTLGPDHPLVAQVLNNLAITLVAMGDLAAARPLEERVLAAWTTRLGPDAPAVAVASLNLADLDAQMGDHAAARPLYERALSIWERAHGPGHPRVARALRGLGLLLIETGDYSGARPPLARALDIRQKGPEDELLAESLRDLGRLARLTGDHAAAEPLLERALAIQEQVLGRTHPEVAATEREIAALCLEDGDVRAARSRYERALEIDEASLGATHNILAATLAGLARTLLATGDSNGGLGAGLRAEAIGREHLRLTARSLSERQALRYAAVRGSGLDAALSVAARGTPPGSVREIWDALIRSRALVLDEMASRHRSLVGFDDPAVHRLVEDLSLATRRLANLTLRGPSDEEPTAYLRTLEEARARKERAEHALAEKSLAFRMEQDLSRAGFSDVKTGLPAGGALVAYALYRELPTAPRGESAVAPGAPVRSYLAFVMRADAAEPVVVPLGPAEAIDDLVERWREEAGSRPRAGRASGTEDEARYVRVAQALRRLVWDPLASHVKNAKIVFVVPDAALHVVSFAALPGDGSPYLLESGPTLHYLSAERDLVAANRPDVMGKGLLALGGPAYDEDSLFASLAKEPTMVLPVALSTPDDRLTSRRPFRSMRPSCGDFESIRFAPLPASVREVRDVARIWDAGGGPTLVLTGAGAGEADFKAKAGGRRVLHLATHGFFLGGRCSSTPGDSRGIGAVAEAGSAAQPPEVPGNPLLISGLALAGANRRRAAGPAEDDGILTAEEVAAMNLSGVEWAVLSACDTGVGQVEAGEGVLGLRRSFQVAGARTTIMSLWSVEDEPTREWMNALYEGRLAGNLGTAEAVREAALQVLRRQRVRGRSGHPFSWGAFVAAGDWR